MQTKQKIDELKSLDKTLYNMVAYFHIDKMNIPLPREKFTKYITSIKNQSNYIDDLNSLNRKYNIDASVCSSPLEDKHPQELTRPLLKASAETNFSLPQSHWHFQR